MTWLRSFLSSRSLLEEVVGGLAVAAIIALVGFIAVQVRGHDDSQAQSQAASPAATTPDVPTPDVPTTTPVPAPATSTTSEPLQSSDAVLLADVPDIKVDGDGPRPINIDGTTYDSGYRSNLASCAKDMRNTWDFDLARKYSRFRAVAGVLDESEGDTTMRFRVLTDNHVVLNSLGKLGQPKKIDLDVSGVLRLRLEVVATRNTCGADDREDIGGFGNPSVE